MAASAKVPMKNVEIPSDPTAPVCGLDDPRIRTFGLMLEAHTRLTRTLDADLRDSDGISLQTLEVLLRIGRSEHAQVTMSELASAVALTTGGVTRLADRLETDGLVKRVACPGDRRVVRLALTDAGAEMLRTAIEHHLDHLDRRVTSRIDAADLPTFERVMDQLRQPQD